MKHLMLGCEAIVEGAIKAGASFYAGYPISPATEILVLAAEQSANNPDFRFVQSEDEIAAANAIMGASLAGAKSFTATSGPGFTLMQEAIGYGHMVEIPAVLVNVQRVGPATSMPTMPAQQDIIQTHYGSAGDYYPIAFYPNSVEECYRYAVAAFNAAEESLSPAILLADGFIGHLSEAVDIDEIDVKVTPRSRPPLGTGKRFFTGLAHDDYNHSQTADAEIYKAWLAKVKARHQKVAAKHAYYEYRENKKSDTLLIAFGIVSRAVLPLLDKYALFRPIRIFPVLSDELRECAKEYQNIVVVEANDGQYASLVEREIHRDVTSVPIQGGRVSLELIKEGLVKANV